MRFEESTDTVKCHTVVIKLASAHQSPPTEMEPAEQARHLGLKLQEIESWSDLAILFRVGQGEVGEYYIVW